MLIGNRADAYGDTDKEVFIMMDCIFCKIIAGKLPADILYQNDKIIVFRDIKHKAKIHLLVVSKEHIKNLVDVNEDHSDLLSQMVLILSTVAKQQGLEKGFRTVINTGSGGGQEIDHLHFHLLGGGLARF
jgi:histidine triad (HIT) family protein